MVGDRMPSTQGMKGRLQQAWPKGSLGKDALFRGENIKRSILPHSKGGDERWTTATPLPYSHRSERVTCPHLGRSP